MADSRQVAGLVGPPLVAMTVAELANPTIWVGVPAAQVYLAGSLWFVGGLAIVRSHNRWRRDWTLLITLVGWFLMVGGLTRMFAPGLAQQGAGNQTVVLGGQIGLLAAGAALTWNAYRPAEGAHRAAVPPPGASPQGTAGQTG